MEDLISSVCLGSEDREVRRPQGITDARKIVWDKWKSKEKLFYSGVTK